MPNILPQVKNIVVVMMENRSLDNLCGWLYSKPATQTNLYLPAGSPAAFNGLDSAMWNPSNVSYFGGQAPVKVPVVNGTSSYLVPDPDPEETFSNVSYQLFGPETPSPTPTWQNQGFIVNYEYATASTANQIMEAYSTAQLPVLSSLAQNFAISDEWFCSVPSQTWPNRSFVHAGTSNGNVNNGDVPDPLDWDVPTIFNVLELIKVDWRVYCDTIVTPSLTRTMFPGLWDPFLDGHFGGFDDFKDDCANNSLPPYTFLEPSFLFDPNDQHPPHDVNAGEQFLYEIWQAVSASPGYNNIMLIITYDEHGGTYDHVPPFSNAATPDAASDPGESGFYFNRFGVRVPTIVVSPYVKPGTVFRSPNYVPHSQNYVPYDHTSILATLRDWLAIPASSMLPSARIAAAPNLAQVLTLQAPAAKPPVINPPAKAPAATSTSLPLNDLQKSLVTASARRFGMQPAATLRTMKSRQHAVDFFTLRASRKNAY
jgi:phospholipase C